jgi:hypothetical protein
MSPGCAGNMGVATKGTQGPDGTNQPSEKATQELSNHLSWLHGGRRRGLRAIDIIRRLKPEARKEFGAMPAFVNHLKALCADESSELDWIDIVVCGRVDTIVFSVRE